MWRDGRKQANLACVRACVRACVLTGVGIEPLGKEDGKRIGELIGRAGSADVVDAHVALLVAPHDVVLTGDSGDIRTLLHACGVPARVQQVRGHRQR